MARTPARRPPARESPGLPEDAEAVPLAGRRFTGKPLAGRPLKGPRIARRRRTGRA